MGRVNYKDMMKPIWEFKPEYRKDSKGVYVIFQMDMNEVNHLLRDDLDTFKKLLVRVGAMLFRSKGYYCECIYLQIISIEHLSQYGKFVIFLPLYEQNEKLWWVDVINS